MKKINSKAIVIMLITTLFGCSSSEDDNGNTERLLASDIVVKNINFQRCIDSQIANNKFEYADQIESLLCQDVASIDGIEQMINIKNLHLTYDIHYKSNGNNGEHTEQLTDIEPITALTKLEVLWLENEHIDNYDILAEIDSLKTLVIIADRSLRNISFVESLPKLKYLRVEDTGLTDITPLLNVTTLEALYMHGNLILTDISLKHMTNLRELGMNNSFSPATVPIMLLSSIKDSKALEKLMFAGSNTPYIPMLDNPSLVSLDASQSETRLKNTYFLDSFTFNEDDHSSSLETIYLDKSGIDDIETLSRIPNLKSVSLTRNELNDSAISSVIDNFVEFSPDIESINLHCNNLSIETVSELREALPNTNVIFEDGVYPECK